MSTRHADAARDRLRAAAEPILLCPHAALTLRRAAAVAADAEDIQPAADGVVALVVETEGAIEELKRHAERLRAALREVMLDVGFPRAPFGAGHAAHLAKSPDAITVTDLAAIPDELKITPDPKPNVSAILARLRDGEDVPGVTRRNTEMVLKLKQSKSQ